MLDLLAAIVSADPPSLLAWLVLAFAASGYPLGIMLGSSCSPCCNSNPCTQCTEGELPETLTVTFDGLQDRTPGPDLCLLTVSAPYGSGAAGKVTSPGGDPDTDKGPISAASVTNGGSGYAQLGRVAPTITASGGSGSGATFSVSTTSANDANGIPSWSVTGVTFTGTTSGYIDGEALTITAAEGDTVVDAATAVVTTQREEPTLSLSGNAEADITYTDNNDGTWSIESIAVTDGGSGYVDGEAVGVTLGEDDTAESEALLYGRTNRIQPSVTVFVPFNPDGGSGAQFSATVTPSGDAWAVSSVSVTAAGSGYSVGDRLSGVAAYPVGQSYDLGEVTAVNQDGGITAVSASGGEFWDTGGVLVSVDIGNGGRYFKDTGTLASVNVTNGGQYYREDASEPPYVATVTVGVSQTAPSDGAGATLTATVEDDTASANFGKITGVTIDNGGTNYLAWQWRNTKCCGDYYNGLSVVVKRLNYGSGDACRYSHRMCGVGNIRSNFGQVEVFYNGPNTPPTVVLTSELPPDSGNASSICNATFTASGNVNNCGDWSGVSFSASGGRTATVSAGGEYDPLFRNPGGLSCFVCCKGEEEVPAEESVELSDNRANKGDHDFSGTYVLGARIVNPSFQGYRRPQILRELVVYQVPGTNINYTLSVVITPCSHQFVGIGGGGGDFLPDEWGCDYCHKKCKMFAILFQNIGGGTPWFSDEGLDCGTCEETPICSIGGKTFALRLGGDASGAEDFTLTT
jgi:hypothetical protein